MKELWYLSRRIWWDSRKTYMENSSRGNLSESYHLEDRLTWILSKYIW